MMTYPIFMVPQQIKTSIESEIVDEEIFEHLNLKYPILDLRIYITYTIDFYLNDKEKDKKLNDFKVRFPNAKLVEKGYFSESYEITYPINEVKFFNSEYTFGKAHIGSFDISQPPKKISYETVERKENGCLFGIVALSLIFLSLTWTLNFYAFVFLAVVSIIFFICYSKSLQKSVKETIEVPKDLSSYNKEFEAFKLSVENIKKLVRQRFEDEVIQAKKIAAANRIKTESEIYLSSIKPLINFKKVSSNENRGKVEIFFLKKLYQKFGNQILVDIYPTLGKNPFQPDFMFICEKTGFCMNIEIDEPYTAENGKPIHHDRCEDEKRNSFFLESNIMVLRLTERQVIKNAVECCELIENIVQAIRNKQFPRLEHNIETEKKWTYEEALIFSNNNYRNSYLPENLKIKAFFKKENNSDKDLYDDLPF